MSLSYIMLYHMYDIYIYIYNLIYGILLIFARIYGMFGVCISYYIYTRLWNLQINVMKSSSISPSSPHVVRALLPHCRDRPQLNADARNSWTPRSVSPRPNCTTWRIKWKHVVSASWDCSSYTQDEASLAFFGEFLDPNLPSRTRTTCDGLIGLVCFF